MPRWAYPEPQYTSLLTMVAPLITDAPAGALQRMVPLDASIATKVCAPGAPDMEGAYTTPLATDTGPMSLEPFGSGVCHRIAPVAGSSAAHEPAFPALEGIP